MAGPWSKYFLAIDREVDVLSVTEREFIRFKHWARLRWKVEEINVWCAEVLARNVEVDGY